MNNMRVTMEDSDVKLGSPHAHTRAPHTCKYAQANIHTHETKKRLGAGIGGAHL